MAGQRSGASQDTKAKQAAASQDEGREDTKAEKKVKAAAETEAKQEAAVAKKAALAAEAQRPKRAAVAKTEAAAASAAAKAKPKEPADPNAPKKPTTAYVFYTSENKAAKTKEALGTGMTCQQFLNKEWQKMGESVKAPYFAQATKDKERYAKEVAAYKPSGGGGSGKRPAEEVEVETDE